MNTLRRPNQTDDFQCIRAAEGWLALGLHVDCLKELDRVSADRAASLDVLLIRCKALICAGETLAAYELAEVLTKGNPAVAEAWALLGRIAALVPSKGSAAAIELMEAVVPNFPKEPAIPFTLACLTCRIGRLVDSHSWWMRALDIAKNQGTDREWKRRALIEPDLQLLWTAESLG